MLVPLKPVALTSSLSGGSLCLHTESCPGPAPGRVLLSGSQLCSASSAPLLGPGYPVLNISGAGGGTPTLPDPPWLPLLPHFKWVVSKPELVREEASLVVRGCQAVSREYLKARRQGQGRQLHAPEAGSCHAGGRGSTLFCVTSEVKLVAMVGTSDSRFQPKVRRTFPLGLFKGEPG